MALGEGGGWLAQEATAATPDDVVGVYQLVLRREPESEHAIAANVGAPLFNLLRVFFDSDEFAHQIRHPVDDGRFCPAVLEEPRPEAVAWVCRRLPLSATGRTRLKAAPNWLVFYRALLTDSVFVSVMGAGLWSPPAPDSVFEGEVWGSDGRVVNGWLRSRETGASPAQVELWSDGRLFGRGLANVFDRGLEARFPGLGNCAFRVAVPDQRADADLVVDVREATTGWSFGQVHVRQIVADRGDLGEVDARLEALANEISALRAVLPDVSHQVATPLERYGEHYRRWLADPFGEPPYSDVEVAVVVDAVGVSSLQVEAIAQAVMGQTHARLSLHLVVAASDAELFGDLARRLAIDGGLVEAVGVDDLRLPDTARLVQLISARCLPHPDLVAAGAVFLEREVSVHAVYFDEDVLEGRSLSGLRRDPRFKPEFDDDLLLQTPYVGTGIMVRAADWSELAPRLSFGGGVASSAALMLEAARLKIGHSPVVMTSWRSEEDRRLDERSWGDQVRAHFARQHTPARVVDATDDLGAPKDGSHRIVWPLRDRAAATVIIPTRDGLDLLRPCLESLFAFEAANRTVMELIVIDHESSDEATIAYLTELSARPRTRVLPYSGAFNWALMNNLAAKEASGDVLVFLNNDTLAVSEGWLDELTAQALRPEVGAVGVRLIYPDGALQHGGFVAGEHRDVFLCHEGVGTPGVDGGYLGRHALVRRTAAVTGACMAVAASRFSSMGGFEAAAFPVDGNDVDFCFRARALGLKVLYTPYATFHHLESKTRGYGATEQQRADAEAALDRLWSRWGDRFGRDPYYNANFDRIAEPFMRLRPPPRLSGRAGRL